MLYDPGNKIIKSQQGRYFFHISFCKFLSDVGTADLPGTIHLLWKDFHLKSVFHTGFFQKFRSPLSLKAKAKIFSDRHVGCFQRACQHLTDKRIRLHMPDVTGQRTFQQDICSHVFQKISALWICKNCFSVRNKGQHNCMDSGFFFPLQNFVHQFPVSPVDAVKLPQSYCTVVQSGKLIFDSHVFHVLLLMSVL